MAISASFWSNVPIMSSGLEERTPPCGNGALNLGARGGSHARRRAVVAVARKLAVLLNRIWVTQEVYVPFHAIPA
jgi:hypothetical protein